MSSSASNPLLLLLSHHIVLQTTCYVIMCCGDTALLAVVDCIQHSVSTALVEHHSRCSLRKRVNLC
jgi:hypothetical protein